MSEKVSLRNLIASLDGRTVIAILFTVSFMIISIIAILKGYIKEILSMYTSFLGLILGYYFGAKTREVRRE